MNQILEALGVIGEALRPVAREMVQEFAREFARTLVQEVRDRWQEAPLQTEPATNED